MLMRSLIVASCILISNAAVQAVSSSSVENPNKSIEAAVADSACISSSDLELQYGRLMSLPEHLRPAALKSLSSGTSAATADWNEEQEVWLCPDQTGSSPTDLQRVDFHNGLVCADMELLFSLYTSDEVVSNSNMNHHHHPQEAIGFDYQAWCKCPGAVEKMMNRDQSCQLCPDGQKVKRFRWKELLSVTRGGGKIHELSCDQALDYARHVTSKDRCLDALKEARSFCCEATVSTKPEDEELMLSFRDTQVVLLLIAIVTAFCYVVTIILMYIMGAIDKYYGSWEYL